MQEQNSGTWGPAKCVTDVLTDIFYDLLFYRLTATWSLFDLYDKKKQNFVNVDVIYESVLQ